MLWPSSVNSIMSRFSASSGARARDRKYRSGFSGCRAEMCPNESSTRSRARMWLAVTSSSVSSCGAVMVTPLKTFFLRAEPSMPGGGRGYLSHVVRQAVAAPYDVHVGAEQQDIVLIDLAHGIVGDVEHFDRGTAGLDRLFEPRGVRARAAAPQD